MQRRRFSFVVFLLSAVAIMVCASSAYPEAGETTLWRLAAQSDAVLLGRVTQVMAVPVETLPDADVQLTEANLAKITVQEWIKGKSRPKTLWFWAQGTWTCDVTRAIEGEQGLFFLEAIGVGDLVTPRSMKALAEATSGAVIHRVAWSGRGRMPFRSIGGRDYATVWEGEVRLPAGMESVPGPDPRYTSFMREVLVGDLKAYLKARVGRLPKPVEGQAAKVVALLRALYTAYGFDCEVGYEVVGLGAKALPTLREIVRDAASPLRENAAAVMVRLPELGQTSLIEDLRSKDRDTRRGAAFAIELNSRRGSIDRDAFTSDLTKALGDSDPEVRWRALRVLAEDRWSDDYSLEAVLAAALQDESRDVRWHAARLVQGWFYSGAEGTEEKAIAASIEPLLLELAARDELRLRRAAWEALSVTAGVASWKAAQGAFLDPDPVVRINVIGALGRIPSPAATRLLVSRLTDVDPWMRRAVVRALGIAAAKDGVEPLVKGLQDTDDVVRSLAVWGLGRIGPEAATALPALRKLLDTEADLLTRSDVLDAIETIRK